MRYRTQQVSDPSPERKRVGPPGFTARSRRTRARAWGEDPAPALGVLIKPSRDCRVAPSVKVSHVHGFPIGVWRVAYG